MEQQLCLNPSCQKPIEAKEGKRQKKYCDDNCRASHWSKTHSKKGVKWVKKELYEAVVKERDEMALYLKQIGMDDWKWDNRIVETILIDETSHLLSTDKNKQRLLESVEQNEQVVAKEKKVSVIKDKVANNGIVIKKGYNTYLAEVKKAKTMKELEALYEEIHNNASLHENDSYKLMNAINAKKINQ